jgi:hypothetical protein
MSGSSCSGIGRREFIAATAGTVAAALAPSQRARARDEKLPALIDTNINVSRWPFRRLPLDETPALVAKLRENGVSQAWAGSFEALLHKDIASVNSRLTDECQRNGGGLLRPVGSVNPALPAWEDDLRRCAEEHQMRAIRLHPNYHGYKLGDPVFQRVLGLAAARGLLVQIAIVMEDERTLHPLVNVPPVDTAPLAEVLAKVPTARVQLLNAFRTLRGLPVKSLAAHGVTFEIAMLEGVEGVANLLKQVPLDKVCFGSYAPFLYFESALLKLKESVLDPAQSQAVRAGNACSLLT